MTEITGILSKNGKLQSGTALDDIKNKEYKKTKEQDKAILRFKQADINNDNLLDDDEITAYDKYCKKQKLKTAVIIAGCAIGLAAVSFAIYKGIKLNKTKQSLEKTKNALSTSEESFSQIENLISSHDFSQYGKSGIPLKYPREVFVDDILKSLDGVSPQEKAKILKKFNLKTGVSDVYKSMEGLTANEQEKIVNEIHAMLGPRDINTTICELSSNAQRELYSRFNLKMNIGDLDGIPILPKKQLKNPAEIQIADCIERFYHNETTVADPKLKEALDRILKEFPEFGMTIGKHQHITHLYSVDVHTFEVLKSALNNPALKNLTAEDKLVTELSILIHDFGKKGNIVTEGHAAISKIYAEKILQKYNLSRTVKKRIIKQVANHHWFEKYNKGLLSKQDILNIFETKKELTLAKIIAKGDIEGVSPIFHRKILCPGKILTQEEFDIEFAKKLSEIHF